MNNIGLSSLNNTYYSNMSQKQTVKPEQQENMCISQAKQSNKQIC